MRSRDALEYQSRTSRTHVNPGKKGGIRGETYPLGHKLVSRILAVVNPRLRLANWPPTRRDEIYLPL
jgi:hypothetical protein